jgi:tRNA (mo5U34)-methyltransferase
MVDSSLKARIDAVPQWYHTLELAPGVVTPGWFDLRETIAALPFPDDLTGRRCLDIGTFDGFWAFEMERRGADEVVAVDLLDPGAWDWPHGSDAAVVDAIGQRKAGGSGFEVARDALGSSVERRELSVYDLDPDDIGTFDFVYVGSLLLHLRDPVRALERARSVCRGEALLVDAIDGTLSTLFPRRPMAGLDGKGRPWWWKPNVAGLVRMVEAAGFEVLGDPVRTRLRLGPEQPKPRVMPSGLRSRGAREHLLIAHLGDPHAAVRARPR